ncbi:unnamed protein product [marine sediment metagenome]|uniref:Uncharacterized protein n=1 Tax=marine sediment metagenome TaxID=412755 RepID=X1RX28_9ZZZZ
MTMPPLPRVKPPEEITKQVPLAYNVLGTERIKIAELCPLTGIMTSVTFAFPDGCDSLVHVAFGHGDKWVAPSEMNTFISLNNVSPVFPTSEPVIKNEHLWAEIRNGDILPHFISVIATIIGRGS